MPDEPINPTEFLSRTAIDPADAGVTEMMRDLQGNILKGHGRRHTLHLFFRFSPEAPLQAIREWLLEFVRNRVTTALEQFDQTVRFRRTGEPGAAFCNLLLSHRGYEALQVTPEKIPTDASFRTGMKGRGDVLADPPPTQWETGYQQHAGAEIHGMLLVANTSPDLLEHESREILARTRALLKILHFERGSAVFNARGDSIEHFGYVDGRSQPLFFREDIQFETERCGGTDLWDPSAQLNLALVADPASPNPLGFGSYMVFRKLEQNVAGFKALEDALAGHLTAAGGQHVGGLAGALVVGRHRDGTPATVRAIDGLNEPITNNFNYEGDAGVRCPFHAHIRKANPRTTVTRERRIARRGITYGERDLIAEDRGVAALPERGVGLLFMCFQARLGAQFEFIQDKWANEPGFPNDFPLGNFADHGIDPLIGQFVGIQAVNPSQIAATDLPSPSQPWPARYDAPTPAAQAPFWGFVKMLGGEYFFAPSVSGLLNLLAPDADPST